MQVQKAVISIFKKALANESESSDPAEGGAPWPNMRGLPWHTGSSKYMNGNQPRVPEGRCRGKRYQDQTAHHSTARSMSFSLGTPRPNHAPGIERSICTATYQADTPRTHSGAGAHAPSTLFHVKHQFRPHHRGTSETLNSGECSHLYP